MEQALYNVDDSIKKSEISIKSLLLMAYMKLLIKKAKTGQ